MNKKIITGINENLKLLYSKIDKDIKDWEFKTPKEFGGLNIKSNIIKIMNGKNYLNRLYVLNNIDKLDDINTDIQLMLSNLLNDKLIKFDEFTIKTLQWYDTKYTIVKFLEYSNIPKVVILDTKTYNKIIDELRSTKSLHDNDKCLDVYVEYDNGIIYMPNDEPKLAYHINSLGGYIEDIYMICQIIKKHTGGKNE